MPQATVAAIIVKQAEGQELVLLTRRNVEPFKNSWCLPGGHIDQDEPASEAVIREVKEEVGIEFNPTFFRYFDEILPEKKIHAVVLAFIGREWTGDIIFNPDEVLQADWFPLSQALLFPLAFNHKLILVAFQTFCR